MAKPSYYATLKALKSDFGLTHRQAQKAYTGIRTRLDRSPTAGDIHKAAGSKAAQAARYEGRIPPPPAPAKAPRGGKRESGASGAAPAPAQRFILPPEKSAALHQQFADMDFDVDLWTDDPDDGSYGET